MINIIVRLMPLLLLLLFSECSKNLDYLEQSKFDDVVQLPTSDNAVNFKVKWWQDFASDELNSIIDKALEQNLNIEIAKAKIRQAHSLLKEVKTNLYPSFDLSISKTKELGGDDDNGFDIDIRPDYTLDLWGYQFAKFKSSEELFIAKQYDTKAAAMIVIHDIVNTWINILAAKQKQNIISHQVDVAERLFELYTLKHTSNLVEVDDVLYKKLEYDAYKVELANITREIQVMQNTIKILMGLSPMVANQVTKFPHVKLVNLPIKGLSSSLLQDRPDILSAWHTLQAANLKLYATKANILPSFNISLDLSSAMTNAFLQNWTSILKNSINYTGLDWGYNKAVVRGQGAVKDQDLATYLKVVYNAVAEVRSIMLLEKVQQHRVAFSQDDLYAANVNYEHSIVTLENSIDDSYSYHLDNLNFKYSKEIELINKEKDLNIYRINLYNALGGNVWRS